MDKRTRTNLLFYIKRTKLKKNGQAPVYLKLTVNGESCEISIGCSVIPEIWSPDKGGAIGTTKEARIVNDYISQTSFQIHQHIRNLREDEKEITITAVKNAYLGIAEKVKTINSVWQEHNENISLLEGKDYVKSTILRYKCGLRYLKEYMLGKYKLEEMPLTKVDNDFVTGFEVFLKSKKNCAHNSTMKHMKALKKMINHALANEWIKKDPFVSYKITSQKVDRGFLTENELYSIINKNFELDRLQKVKDIFLFGCFTGLSFSDIKSLTQKNIVLGEGGMKWIKTKRLKTDVQCSIPLLPMALEILEKYKNDPYCITKNVLLPISSNQKFNSYLKEIADLCGINKNITSHLARHTFATTVTLNNDIPIESVSKMLGHSSITMTKIYARLLDKKVSQDMSKIYNKFSIV